MQKIEKKKWGTEKDMLRKEGSQLRDAAIGAQDSQPGTHAIRPLAGVTPLPAVEPARAGDLVKVADGSLQRVQRRHCTYIPTNCIMAWQLCNRALAPCVQQANVAEV